MKELLRWRRARHVFSLNTDSKNALIVFAAAELPRIFESFYSTKRGGMGLGLAIVRSIVEAHGGTIRVARHDDGAEFLVVLPHPPAPDSAPPPARTHAA